jgi:hypothetical protein
MLMLGAHPEDAVRQAVRSGEDAALQRNAQIAAAAYHGHRGPAQ